MNDKCAVVLYFLEGAAYSLVGWVVAWRPLKTCGFLRIDKLLRSFWQQKCSIMTTET